jgi:hypothetical protein
LELRIQGVIANQSLVFLRVVPSSRYCCCDAAEVKRWLNPFQREEASRALENPELKRALSLVNCILE